jgi:hypothetical protein
VLGLIPPLYGNRSPDWLGNLHVARDRSGLVVFRNPGRYVGRHRRVS